nr:MAG TPA: hypothetical protein [Caudoviricetes sp.]
MKLSRRKGIRLTFRCMPSGEWWCHNTTTRPATVPPIFYSWVDKSILAVKYL